MTTPFVKPCFIPSSKLLSSAELNLSSQPHMLPSSCFPTSLVSSQTRLLELSSLVKVEKKQVPVARKG
ncbi:hypothetical protein O6P43_023938 [Quillaja saponaria]|uniref:Uncharacterized protein n=1 Tax=Quillaja saponaria TaxID=32244 RepID=A0AAD7LGA9_QUISA|nr:hypothetical protein O6P43_023938 [Quillaja saponaria]